MVLEWAFEGKRSIGFSLEKYNYFYMRMRAETVLRVRPCGPIQISAVFALSVGIFLTLMPAGVLV